jgi:hypothetical protein
MMQIFSPSYKRSKTALTHNWFPDLTYVVHEFEIEEYKRAGLKAIAAPDETRGNIARVRNWILNQFGSANLVILDDDIESVKRWEMVDGNWIQKILSGDEFLEFIEMGFIMAEDWGVRLWGMNCLGDKGSYREYTPFSCKSYISASFHGILPGPLRYDERIPLKEDFDFCIQNLSRYRAMLRFNMFSMVKKDHGNPGGCAVYRTIEREKEQLELLQKKWGTHLIKNDLTEKTTQKKKNAFDLNPIMKVPIAGI